MKNTKFALIPLLAFMASCATVTPGNDVTVVDAERITTVAVDTFDGFVKFEKDNRAQLPVAVHVYAEKIRHESPMWLMSARAMTMAYKHNRTAQNKASLATAIQTLQAAITQTEAYMQKTN